jgi:threonylcarbamoyladenosine tRNA methylthiotransferase MtaB
MPEVTALIGNAEKLAPDTWTALAAPDTSHQTQPRDRVGDIMAVRQASLHPALPARGHDGQVRARAFVQVQNGCDHRCTFCIIPFGRGPSRSVPMQGAIARVAALAEAGHREVVLTGVDLTSWGEDLPGTPKLGTLVQAILTQVPDLPRLRLSSIDAIEIDPALETALACEPRLAPYLHLSLQHGDDLILKRMKRRHSRAEALALISRLRLARPDLALGADLIAGFPTETEDAHQRNLSLITEAGLAFLHVFPYSPRPGTPAARMPPVDPATITRRAAELRAQGEAALRCHLDGWVGREAIALIESHSQARLDDFTPVRLTAATPDGQGRGEGPSEPLGLVRVAVTGHDGRGLEARLIATLPVQETARA